MDSISLFRPVFSLAVHAARAHDDTEDGARTCFADVDRLLADIRARRHSGTEYFADAWFALCAWLDETLARSRARLGDAAPPPFTARLLSEGNDAGEEFFTRLDRLLRAVRTEEDGARAATAVYGLCLALGFRGPHGGEEGKAILKTWRKRCRAVHDGDAKERAASPSVPQGELAWSQAGPAAPQPSSRASSGCSGSIVPWLLPPAITAGLFVLYRLLLSDLYVLIAG